MKPQTTSIFLCALLLTTFGHEYRAAHQIHKQLHGAKESRSQHHNDQPSSRLLASHNFKYRAEQQEDGQVCGWNCPAVNELPIDNDSGDLSIIYNKTTNVFGVVNVSGKVAIVIDLNAGIGAIFNGKTGSVILVNYKLKTGVHITADRSKSVWQEKNEPFEAYFTRQCSSLKDLFKVGQSEGTSFDEKSVSVTIQKEIKDILLKLSPDLAPILNLKNAVGLLLNIVGDLLELLGGVLSGLLSTLGGGLVKIAGDLAWLIKVLRGLVGFVGKITGGLGTVLKKTTINLGKLLQAKSGLHLLLSLLKALSSLDLTVVLKDILGDLETLLEVVLGLGGHSDKGLNGLVKIVLHLLKLSKGKIENDVLIQTLLRVSVQAKIDVEELKAVIKGILEIAEAQKSKCKNLQVLQDFLAHVNLGNLEIGKVRVSEVLKVLLKIGELKPIEVVVKILVAVKSLVDVKVSVPNLLLDVMLLLNTTEGIQLIAKVFVNIKIDLDADVKGGNILGSLLKDVDIENLKAGLKNPLKLLTSLPIIGQILKDIGAAVQAELKVSLVILVGTSAKVLTQIVAWLTAIVENAKNGDGCNDGGNKGDGKGEGKGDGKGNGSGGFGFNLGSKGGLGLSLGKRINNGQQHHVINEKHGEHQNHAVHH